MMRFVTFLVAPSLHPRSSSLVPRMQSPGSFEASVNLGEGSGVVEGDLSALYTRSTLLTVRFELPFTLECEPLQGVMRVKKAGNGLLVGDVLRACSTLEFRHDSARREYRIGSGMRGKPTIIWSAWRAAWLRRATHASSYPTLFLPCSYSYLDSNLTLT
jgi:hypothetical protein